MTIHERIMTNWSATTWEQAYALPNGVLLYSLYGANGEHIVTDTLLNLDDRRR